VSAAFRTMAVLLVALPFISYAVVPTEVITALWALSVVLFTLTVPCSLKRDFALAAACLFAVFCYGSAVVTIVPLVLLHFVFFRPAWPLRRLFSLAGFGIGAAFCAVAIRRLVAGHAELTRWGVGLIEIPPPGKYIAGIKVMLIDVFWRADSWYSGGFGKPYLNFVFSFLLVVGLVRAGHLLISRPRPHRADSPDEVDAQVALAEPERWCCLFFLTFCIAPLLAGINVGTPGVRRIFTAALLLVPIIAMAPGLRWRPPWIRTSLNVLFAGALCLEAFSSTQLIRSLWPPPPALGWFVTAEAIAAQLKTLDRPAVILVDRELEPALDRVFCRLDLDETTKAKAMEFYGIELSKDGRLILTRNGEPPAVALTPAQEGGFILFCKTQSRAKELADRLAALPSPHILLRKIILIPAR